MGQYSLSQHPGSKHIDIKNRFHFFERNFFQCPEDTLPGIVHHNIQRTFCDCQSDRALDIFRARNINLDAFCSGLALWLQTWRHLQRYGHSQLPYHHD
jgi:hypothetical protein